MRRAHSIGMAVVAFSVRFLACAKEYGATEGTPAAVDGSAQDAPYVIVLPDGAVVPVAGDFCVVGGRCYPAGQYDVGQKGICNARKFDRCGAPGNPCCPASGFYPAFCQSGAICAQGSCEVCGGVGAPCCDEGKACFGSCCDIATKKCVATDVCAPTCGAPGTPCCPNAACLSGSTCSGGQCVACDQAGKPCCVAEGVKSCSGSFVCDPSDQCVSCGGPGEACCEGNSCAGGTCNPDTKRCEAKGSCGGCGGLGEACCPGPSCLDDGCCENNVCVSNGSRCANGYTCTDHKCECGTPGHECCAGNVCNNGGCCDGKGHCTAAGSFCGFFPTFKFCQNGSCQ